MAAYQRWYGGSKGSSRNDRCSVCATKYSKPNMHYVRLQNAELWYDSRFCGACYNQMKHKLKIDRIYSETVPMDIYNDLRNEYRTKRAINILKYGDV